MECKEIVMKEYLRMFDVDLKYVFPRWGGIKRRDCRNFDDVFLFDFISIFSKLQVATNVYDTIFIDFDIKGEFKEYREIANRIIEVAKTFSDFRWYFTGSGFHCYIDFPFHEFKGKYEYREKVRRFVYELFEKYGLVRYIDFKVVGDVKRVSRRPFVKHDETNLYMIRFNPDDVDDFVDILEMSVTGKSYYIGKIKRHEFVLDELENIVIKKRNIEINDGIVLDRLPDCIKKGIEIMILTGELQHEWRFHIASYLKEYFSVEDVVDVFRFCNDFSYRKTKYYVEHMIKRKYKPYSCRNAMMLGICPGKCPIYDLYGNCIYVKYGGGKDGNLQGKK